MQEKIISKKTAAKLIEDYYKIHYANIGNVKVKTKVEDNDLYMIVKISTVLNHKKIVDTEILNEGQITHSLLDYLERRDCVVQSIVCEPYFHNIDIIYEGDYDITKNNYLTKGKILERKRVYV